MTTERRAAAAVFVFALSLPLATMWSSAQQVDLDAVYRIKQEGLQAQRSQAMEIASYLTDIYGPRLTGSPNINAAADWTMKRMNEWGLTSVHRETWPFGRGWQNHRFVAHAVAPQAYPLIAYSKAWAPGTNGPVTGEAALAVIQNDADLDAWRGQLKGKFVLTAPMPVVAARFEPPGRRFTDPELAELAKQPLVNVARGRGGRGGQDVQAQRAFQRRRLDFFISEGVAALIDPGSGDGGTVFVLAPQGVSYDPKGPPQPPQVVMAVEHYGRILRTLEKQIPVTLQMEIDNRFYDTDLSSFNLIGELAGTDKADEVVMLGAHFDSWHTGTGATDNAAGSAVMLEAMRILKQSGLTPRRTIRIALWTGEEQGLLGSREYVRAHFGDPATMQLKPDHARLSAYFNVDNGTGVIRGVYLQGNEAVAPIFERWMEPFRNLGMTTVAIRGTGGTDHQSFDAVGLPAFQFIQDPIEYDARTHHSNMDVWERIQPNDLMRNAIIVAAFAYEAAMREERLPRKPLPMPPGPGRGAGVAAAAR